MQAWVDYCLINSYGRPEIFYSDDRFRKIILKLCKEKIKSLFNTKLDKFLQEVVTSSIIFL